MKINWQISFINRSLDYKIPNVFVSVCSSATVTSSHSHTSIRTALSFFHFCSTSTSSSDSLPTVLLFSATSTYCCSASVSKMAALLKDAKIDETPEVLDGAGVSPQWNFACDLEVDFESDEHASIVYAALAVDKELQPDKVKRLMLVSDRKLSVHFEAVEARFLRASFSSFVDLMTLATKTIEEFGALQLQ